MKLKKTGRAVDVRGNAGMERRGVGPRRRGGMKQRSVAIAGRAELTEREQAILRDQTAAAFASGRISLRFMGLRFMELFFLGWTPVSGIRCSDAAFEEIWEWWLGLHSAARVEVLRLSRVRV